jgi:hypothetical protein
MVVQARQRRERSKVYDGRRVRQVRRRRHCKMGKGHPGGQHQIRMTACDHRAKGSPTRFLDIRLRGDTRKPAFNRGLPSRWVMSEDARLAHFYYAFGMVFLRDAYHCIFGPRRHLAEFADGLCRHGNARFHLDPHTTRQATKSYVKGGNAFRLIFHRASSLADRVWICFSYRELWPWWGRWWPWWSRRRGFGL